LFVVTSKERRQLNKTFFLAKTQRRQVKDKPESSVSLANRLKDGVASGLGYTLHIIPVDFFKTSAIEFFCVLGGLARESISLLLFTLFTNEQK